MIKKHFTNSEKEALKTFNALSRLVERGIITVGIETGRVEFDSFDEMLTGPILSHTRFKQLRQVTFIKRSGCGFSFAVKITLHSSKWAKRDKQDRLATWTADSVTIGWLKVDIFTQEWIVSAAWQLLWPCPNKEGIMKHDWRSSPVSLKEFSNSL